MTRRNLLKLFTAGSLLLLAGCQGSQTPTSGSAAPSSGNPPPSAGNAASAVPSKGTIGLSVLTNTNPFFQVIGDSLRTEAGKAGYEVQIVSGDQDADKQQNQVKDFLVKKCAAIVLCPSDSKSVATAIKEANDAGVPVFTADIACLDPNVKVVTHVATDNFSGGKEAAKAMIEALGEGGGKIGILGYPLVESCIQRVKGFKEAIDAYNKTRAKGKIDIVSELNGEGKKDIGQKAAEDMMQAHPDIVGIFAINDPSALGARATLEKAGKADQVKLIGFDGQPEGKQAIKEGKIYADPMQFPDKIGAETARAIIRHFAGEKPQKEILIPTSLYRKADADKDTSLK